MVSSNGTAERIAALSELRRASTKSPSVGTGNVGAVGSQASSTPPTEEEYPVVI